MASVAESEVTGSHKLRLLPVAPGAPAPASHPGCSEFRRHVYRYSVSWNYVKASRRAKTASKIMFVECWVLG